MKDPFGFAKNLAKLRVSPWLEDRIREGVRVTRGNGSLALAPWVPGGGTGTVLMPLTALHLSQYYPWLKACIALYTIPCDPPEVEQIAAWALGAMLYVSEAGDELPFGMDAMMMASNWAAPGGKAETKPGDKWKDWRVYRTYYDQDKILAMVPLAVLYAHKWVREAELLDVFATPLRASTTGLLYINADVRPMDYSAVPLKLIPRAFRKLQGKEGYDIDYEKAADMLADMTLRVHHDSGCQLFPLEWQPLDPEEDDVPKVVLHIAPLPDWVMVEAFKQADLSGARHVPVPVKQLDKAIVAEVGPVSRIPSEFARLFKLPNDMVGKVVDKPSDLLPQQVRRDCYEHMLPIYEEIAQAAGVSLERLFFPRERGGGNQLWRRTRRLCPGVVANG
jgi:hypothetical protein